MLNARTMKNREHVTDVLCQKPLTEEPAPRKVCRNYQKSTVLDQTPEVNGKDKSRDRI